MSTYAQRAIWIVTEESLDAKTFGRWWAVNKNYRNQLWYWNMRLRRAVRSIERGVNEESYPREMGAEERKRLEDSAEARGRMRFEQLQKQIADEVMLLAPETAAKILLLATDCENGSDHSYFESIPRLSLSASRLLELLDRQRLWPDVEWEAEDTGTTAAWSIRSCWLRRRFSVLNTRTRLQAIFARRRGQMWWDAQGAMFVGISRLLPAAQDISTALRHGRGICARQSKGRRRRHLRAKHGSSRTRHGSTCRDQWEYLKTVIFSQPPEAGYPDLAQSIIRALGECPITAAKREALLDLLKAPGIQPLLTQEDERYRFYLGWTIRDHLPQQTTAPPAEFFSASGNPLDVLPGIVEKLEARATAGPPVEKCR